MVEANFISPKTPGPSTSLTTTRKFSVRGPGPLSLVPENNALSDLWPGMLFHITRSLPNRAKMSGREATTSIDYIIEDARKALEQNRNCRARQTLLVKNSRVPTPARHTRHPFITATVKTMDM